MPTKSGVIEDVRYEADSKAGVVHVSSDDGVHTATLPIEDIEKYGFAKGVKVDVHLNGSDETVGISIRSA